MLKEMLKEMNLSKISLAVALCLTLAACASGTIKHQPKLSTEAVSAESSSSDSAAEENQDVVIEANPDQISIMPDSELSKDPDLPLQDLDTDTLENLLVMSFASFQGDWETATSGAVSAAASSKDFRIARAATLLALRNNNYQESAKAAEVWLELKPDSINAQNMSILSLLGSSQIDAAKTAIEQQLGEQDVDDYIKQLAGLLVRQPNPEAGFEIADYMVQKNPGSAQVLASAAFVAQAFKKYEAAESWVNQALVVRPGWDLAAQVNANLLAEQNKLEERAAFISQFVKDHPHSVAMRINHATELGRAEQFSDAYALMLEILKDAPKNANALRYAAALAEQLDDTKRAGEHLTKALKVEPSNDEIRWSLGRLAVIDEDFVKAERLFDEIQDESMYVRAQIQVANMRNETQGVELAINTLRALQPRTENDYLQVAVTRHYLLMSAHEYDEAFGYVNESLVYLPDNLELLYARALVAAELGKVEITETDLTKIIAERPEHANALNALGYTLADQTDRYEEAKVLITKALVLRPDDAHILDSMGWVAYRLQDYETAIEFLQKAYDASPEAEVAAHLGEVLWESGEQEKAHEVFKRSFSEDSDNPVLNAVIERYGIKFDDKNGVSASSKNASK